MNISLEDNSNINTIVSYDDSHIVIRNNKNQESSYVDDLIVLPNKIISKRKIAIENHGDIDFLISLKPEIMIIANSRGASDSSNAVEQFEHRGIGIEFIPLGPACRTYNLLAIEGRDVALLIQFYKGLK